MADPVRFDCRLAGDPADQFVAVWAADARRAAERFVERRPAVAAGEFEVVVTEYGRTHPATFRVRCELVPVCFARKVKG